MKKKFFITILLLGNICLFPQSLRIGVGGNFLISNKYYDYQFGPSFLAEYSFEKIPFSIKASTGIYFSELSNEYLPGYVNYPFNFGISINYFPINWAIEPYVGIGAFYYSNSLKAGGMPATINGNIQGIDNSDNNFSLEVIGGIKFSAKTPVNFIVEISQDFSKSRDLISYNPLTRVVIDKKKINIFNSMTVRFGLLFQI